jgi:hypothetical protein
MERLNGDQGWASMRWLDPCYLVLGTSRRTGLRDNLAAFQPCHPKSYLLGAMLLSPGGFRLDENRRRAALHGGQWGQHYMYLLPYFAANLAER